MNWLDRLRRWWHEFRGEWKARRQGARHVDHSGIRRAARDIIGPTGSQFSPGWKHLEKDGAAYVKSFDPKIPPSIFVSPSDLQRRNHPVPLIERCIEDWNRPPRLPDPPLEAEAAGVDHEDPTDPTSTST